MITIDYEKPVKETSSERPKIATTIVLSMSSLMGYGIYETRRQVQRLLNHGDFKLYENGKISRTECLKKLAAKEKQHFSELDELFCSVAESCNVDKLLLNLAIENSKNIVGLMDFPLAELNFIKKSKPEIKKIIENFEVVAIEKIQPSWVLISRNPEEASVHRSMGLTSIPYSKGRIELISEYLRTINPQFCYQIGHGALSEIYILNQTKSTIKMDVPSIYDKPSDVGLVQEYFTPAFIYTLFPEYLSSDPESKLIQMIAFGSFGFFGTDFDRIPADIDTMSLNVSLLYEKGSITFDEANHVMSCVLSNLDENGVLQCYLDKNRPRVDHGVLCNVLYTCYTLGMESHPVARANEQLVHNYFLNDGFLFGTKYYVAPEFFLYLFGKILFKFSDKIPNYSNLVQHFTKALLSRIGKSCAPADIAKRLILCKMFKLINYSDGPQLLSLQNQDGSWNFSDIYVLPVIKGRVQNPTLDMCFCLKAIEMTYFQ